MPGCPAFRSASNRAIAWGITAALCDDVEIYRERIHRIERDRYLGRARVVQIFRTARDDSHPRRQGH